MSSFPDYINLRKDDYHFDWLPWTISLLLLSYRLYPNQLPITGVLPTFIPNIVGGCYIPGKTSSSRVIDVTGLPIFIRFHPSGAGFLPAVWFSCRVYGDSTRSIIYCISWTLTMIALHVNTNTNTVIYCHLFNTNHHLPLWSRSSSWPHQRPSFATMNYDISHHFPPFHASLSTIEPQDDAPVAVNEALVSLLVTKLGPSWC